MQCCMLVLLHAAVRVRRLLIIPCTNCRRVEGDVLVGTDGIWSKIRKQMLGDTPAHYSEYTVYTVRAAQGGLLGLCG